MRFKNIFLIAILQFHTKADHTDSSRVQLNHIHVTIIIFKLLLIICIIVNNIYNLGMHFTKYYNYDEAIRNVIS